MSRCASRGACKARMLFIQVVKESISNLVLEPTDGAKISMVQFWKLYISG
jgi:hypothetical protein